MVETTMDITGWLRTQLEKASPDLLRAMVQLYFCGFGDARIRGFGPSSVAVVAPVVARPRLP